MLLFPPNWTPSMPHLALPTLTAYLRGHGIDVIQRDLNAEVFDRVLTRDYALASLARLRTMPPRRDGPPADLVAWASQHGPRIAEEVDRAKDTIRSQAFYDGPTSLPAFETVLDALRLASLPHFPATLQISTYHSPYRADSSEQILRAADDRVRNMFVEVYEELVVPDVLREDPDVVGISIPCVAQIHGAMTLARAIKRSGARAHVTVGGPMVSTWREQLPTTPRMFELFDSAVVFDGEEPLVALCDAIERGTSLASVPNLIWRDGGTVRVNPRRRQARIGDLPAPDFDGLPLDMYLAPELVLPLAMARGCYFGKCAFCNVGYGEAEVFSQLKGELLLDQLLRLTARHGSRRVFFVDEAMPPRLVRELAPALEALGTPIRWGGCMRFEKVLDRELLETARRGGCAMVLYGLESASQTVMDLMVKGTRLPIVERVLRDSHEAGIWNHTFFFFGFPGETIEDAQQTANFVWSHGDQINSAAMGTFLLERYAPAHATPKVFNIKRVIERPDADLQFYFDYEVASGIDADTAELIARGVEEALPPKQFPQFYVSDVYRFLYATHLADVGAALPPWIPGAATAA
jgi:anaerobic magnesium-protoporphyrin IX monomethyl ester cyclase